jgi:hypothetical protein
MLETVPTLPFVSAHTRKRSGKQKATSQLLLMSEKDKKTFNFFNKFLGVFK